MTVLVLVVAIAFALALLPFRRKITPIAIHNAVAWALVVVFAKLAIPDTARAVDQWIGMTGISRVVYQTLLIAALLVWLKTATFYTHDTERWRRHARGPVALLLLSNLAWLLIRFSGGGDGAYYGGFSARPWPAFLMNMSIAASYAWVTIELIAYHIHVLRTRGAGADRSYLISGIALWASVLPQPAIIVTGTIKTALGGNPADLIQWANMAGAFAAVAGIIFVASRIILSRKGGRFALRLVEPDHERLARDLCRAATTLRAVRRSVVPDEPSPEPSIMPFPIIRRKGRRNGLA